MENNIFHVIAQLQWRQGTDGEEIARDLAKALHAVIKEGNGDCDFCAEFMRLAKMEDGS